MWTLEGKPLLIVFYICGRWQHKVVIKRSYVQLQKCHNEKKCFEIQKVSCKKKTNNNKKLPKTAAWSLMSSSGLIFCLTVPEAVTPNILIITAA